MDITDGQLALMQRVATMPDAPNIVWPDGPGAGSPRFVMQASGGSQRTFTIRGTTEANPEIVVRVETDEGDLGRANKELVSRLVARFPVTLRFDGLTILSAPEVRPPLPATGGVYSVPVIITARQYF